MTYPLKKFIVVGDSLVAWWAVVFLKKMLPALSVTLVGDNSSWHSADAVETVEADFSYLLKLIGLTTNDLLRYADGNYVSAQAFFNWSADEEQYFHSAHRSDLDYELSPYNQWMLKLKQAGNDIKVDEYLLASVAAKEGKITLSHAEQSNSLCLSFDKSLFKQLLVDYANQLGVVVVQGQLEQVLVGADGAIEALLLGNATRVDGDFFVDATGGASLILGSGMGVDFESWSAHLPCDRKKRFKAAPRSDRFIPFTAIQMGSLGWIKNIPLKAQVGAEFTYSASIENVGQGDAMFRMFAGCETNPFNPGVRKKTWIRNCLAIGEAAVTFDNFSHSPLFVAAVSLKRFTEFWPASANSQAVEDEYNRLMDIEFNVIRDFHCLHYALAKKPSTPFGEVLSGIRLPDSLQCRMALFRECGHLCTDEATLVSASQWINLFLGFGYWPQSYDALISHVPLENLRAWASKVKTGIRNSVENAPDYTTYINQCIASR